jgi:integrase/recombinase XerD
LALKLPTIISEDELLLILTDEKIPKHHRFAFAMGFYEAMRISEIINLKLEDVDLRNKLIHIKQAKGHKDRNIPIAPEVLDGLKIHIPLKCGVRALQIAFKKACIRNLKRHDLVFHSLRHGSITHYLMKKGWNSFEVQRLAGHSDISTTEIYTHINPQDLVNRMWKK